MIARVLYNNFALPVLRVAVRAALPFHVKLRRGLAGRRGLLTRVRAFRAAHAEAQVALFHCASAGELEGIRPLARAFRERGFTVAVSFFSPSAYQTAQQAEEFAFGDYLPEDGAGLMRRYLSALKPRVILISKHDVWPNLVWQAARLEIPVWLVNGNFHRRSMKMLPLIRNFHRSFYGDLHGILAVSQRDAARAAALVGSRVRIRSVGDSRYDRVLARARAGRGELSALTSYLAGRDVLVAGSTHARDEQLILAGFGELQNFQPALKLLMVPHDPSEKAGKRIAELCRSRSLSLLEWTEATESAREADVVLINRSGLLADLYAAGNLAYVGGGFDRGVHSVLEPLVHGLPVLCGPDISVSREAREAESLGLLLRCKTARDFAAHARRLLSEQATLSARAREFVRERGGVVERIVETVLGDLERGA